MTSPPLWPTDANQSPLEPLDPALLAETLAALADRLTAQEELLGAGRRP